jgi:hypothetical protein
MIEVIVIAGACAIATYAAVRVSSKEKKVISKTPDLPAGTYRWVDCMVFRAVRGQKSRETQLGVMCQRCGQGAVAEGHLTTCECAECAWPHFHWQCQDCKYKFFILGKDVVA